MGVVVADWMADWMRNITHPWDLLGYGTEYSTLHRLSGSVGHVEFAGMLYLLNWPTQKAGYIWQDCENSQGCQFYPLHWLSREDILTVSIAIDTRVRCMVITISNVSWFTPPHVRAFWKRGLVTKAIHIDQPNLTKACRRCRLGYSWAE